MRFFTVIIGTELLNGRRADEHFAFVNNELIKRGHEHTGSFIIKDDPDFMERVFRFIQNEPDSVMFCFGGIGATPDDYTREIASKVFTNDKPQLHEGAAKLIIERFGDSAYPNRILMAHIPKGASLLHNIINQVPGFGVKNRFFFMPGFPQMAQAMVIEALDTYYPQTKHKLSQTITAFCSEEALIDVMRELPQDLEFSSLPIMDGDIRAVELYIAGYDSVIIEDAIQSFIKEIKYKNFNWRYGGYFN